MIQVVCGKCSSKKSNLAYDNNKPNRVCDKCFVILKNVDGKMVDQKVPKGVKLVSKRVKCLQIKINRLACQSCNKLAEKLVKWPQISRGGY